MDDNQRYAPPAKGDGTNDTDESPALTEVFITYDRRAQSLPERSSDALTIDDICLGCFALEMTARAATTGADAHSHK